jgi:2,3-bisphosphoglycerate-independent phosphoglycerate mutase
MMSFPYIKDICQPTESRIVMLVVDGLGGLSNPETKKTELETARLPNLDRLAQESACGMTIPVFPGVTPGSGPGHLALFGYDPLKYLIGRGVLEALGIDVNLEPGQVAARGNFCTVDNEGLLVDRRAGRISTEETAPICELLGRIQIEGVELSVYPVRDYRFVLVMRGPGLSDELTETDPQRNGIAPLKVKPGNPSAEKTAHAANEFITAAQQILAGRKIANMIMLRGFSSLPNLPSMGQLYQLNPAAIAAYPMYRGLAKVVGMNVLDCGSTFDDEINALEMHGLKHDFIYLHYKPADAAGEDGDFAAKVIALEDLDSYIPRIRALKPDVLIVCGDHSTPALLAGHSWHPVPFLIQSSSTGGDIVQQFSEPAFTMGSLGTMPASHLMSIALAHAGKLTKFGP